MAEFVTLTNQDGDSLVLDLRGAYITSLRTVAGQDVLFTRTQIGEKLRGGIPVCAPIFGPGDSVGLAQHGFARDVAWEVVSGASNELHLRAIPSDSQRVALPQAYRALAMELRVELLPGRLTLGLSLKNGGDVSCVVAPAFHPYFPAGDATSVVVESMQGAQTYTADQLAQTQFFAAGRSPVTVLLDELEITLASAELQQYAVWSANPDNYICVEPSYAGNLPAEPGEELLLAPGAARSYAMQLSWRPR